MNDASAPASPPPPLPFRRATTGRWIAGVCEGLARYQGWDPALVRLGVAALMLATGIIPGVLTYVLAWIIVPAAPPETRPDEPVRAHRLHRSSSDRRIAGVFGGLAESLRIDSALLRLLAAFAMLVTGIFPGLLAYLIAWFVLPVDVPLPQAMPSRQPPPRPGDSSAALGV